MNLENLLEAQARWISRRLRISIYHARLLAELALGNERHAA